MTAGLETPIAAGEGPSLFGIAKSIGAKIRDSAEQAKGEKEKANKEGTEVKKGSLFTKSLKNNFNPLKSKKEKSNWAKGFSWNQPKEKDSAAETKSRGSGGSGGGGSGAKKLKNFLTNAFGLLLKDTTVMVGKLSNISNLTGKVHSANKMMAGSLTSINSLLQEQTEIKRDMLEQAKYARMEKAAEKIEDSSDLSSPITSDGKKKGNGNDGGGDDDDDDQGGGGPLGGLLSALDIADNVLDIGGHLKKTRVARKLKVAGRRGVRSAGRLAKNAKGFGSKFLGKVAGKEGLKAGGKVAAKQGTKAVAKGVGKALLKKIPLIGLVAGVGFGIERMMRGDWGGGLTEIASGAVSTVPGFGTAASVALDAGLMARDLSDPASMMPQEKLSEGGVIPSGVYDNPTTGVLPPGSSVIPLNRNVGKDAIGQGSTDEMLATPMKAVGAAILGITDRMLKHTDSGIAGDMIRQDISRLSRDFGISNPLTTTSLGKGSFGKKTFGKEGEKYFAEVMKKSLSDQGVNVDKKSTSPTPTPSPSGPGAGPETGPGEGGDPNSSSDNPPPGSPPEPTTLSKLQKNVGFVNKKVDNNGILPGGDQVISAATGTDKAGVKRVKMVDWGGQLSDKYYYDKTGRVFFIDPAAGAKSIREVGPSELKVGLSTAGKFYRNLQTGQVVVTNQPPIGYYNYEKHGIVTEKRTLTDPYGNAVRPGDPNLNPDGTASTSTTATTVTTPISSLSETQRKNFGTGLYGPEKNISTIKARSGISVGDKRGMRMHPVYGRRVMHQGTDISAPQGTNLFAFKDGKVLDRRDEGSRSYGKQIHWVEKDTGLGHMYAHLSAFGKNTAAGTEFKKGKILGQIGSTGVSTGPHLHWETGTNPEDTGRMGRSLIEPLSRYSYMAPFTGTPSPGDGVDESNPSSNADSQTAENLGKSTNNPFAQISDIDDIVSKIKDFATKISAPDAASMPAPAAPPATPPNTKPTVKPPPAGGGMNGGRSATPPPKTAIVPVVPSTQLARSNSAQGGVTPAAAPAVATASTPHLLNPLILIRA